MATQMTIAELEQAGERALGTSSWVTIEQRKIDLFAEATGDHQWIHVDPEAAAQGPFGTTIAHGYLTLSLLPAASYEVLPPDPEARMGINYGLNRVRFPAPLPVGTKVRMVAKVADVEDIPGGAQLRLELTFEREGGDKPVCVAQSLARIYAGG